MNMYDGPKAMLLDAFGTCGKDLRANFAHVAHVASNVHKCVQRSAYTFGDRMSGRVHGNLQD